MGLKEQLVEDLKEAMRQRDERRVSAIRMLRAAITNYEIARTDPKHPQHGQPITEGDLVGVLEREIKQRRDALEMLKKAERPELVQKEEAELAILASYMPQQLTREQIRAEVEALAAQHGREFRTLMSIAARALKGRADGRLVNEVVREVTAAS
ncbi:MAG: glutamyl-tRNA amidotransferase [Chloroflexota bacterium]